MPDFNTAVITKKGIALSAKVLAGQCEMHFTKCATGAAAHAAGEDLSNLTALGDQRQQFSFNNASVSGGKQVRLKTTISNLNLTTAYTLREIGVFAQDPTEGEILYSIATAVSGHEDYIPAYEEYGLVTMTAECLVSVSSTENVTIDTSGGAFALQEDLDALALEVYGFAGKVTVFNNDGSITETWEDGKVKQTTFNSDGSITERLTLPGSGVQVKTTVFNNDGSITETVQEGTT